MKIKVINIDTVSALVEYQNYKTAILNMASYKRPGGGVVNGARAQEESLFRCSNLITIPKDNYPLKINEAIYTKSASFFKDVNYEYMNIITTDVITIAAPNLNNEKIHKTDEMNEHHKQNDFKEYLEIIKNKMRLMLTLAQNNNVEVVILGAWGCGVFKNNPNIIANAFKDVINEGFNFKEIIFPIINDHNSVDNNFNIFNTILK